MAVSVNWITGVISVPRADLTLLQSNPTEIRQLDLNAFHLELRSLEEDPDGRPWPKTHKHNTTVTVGGVVLARVIEILAPYTVTFEDGQYAVNLVGANSNVGDVVNVNQVSVRSANSAGLQDLSTLLASAYQGQVVLDPALGQPGTSTPVGTFKVPSNNMAESLVIAETEGLNTLFLNGPLTVVEDLSKGYLIKGKTPLFLVTVDSSADLTSCALENLTVVGELDGMNVLTRCSIGQTTKVSGYIEKCAFFSSVVLNGPVDIYECYSQVEGLGFFEILPGLHTVRIRDFHGSVQITGMTGGVHSVEINGGRLVIEGGSSGTVYARGSPYQVVNNSGGAVTVIEQFDFEPLRLLITKLLTFKQFMGLK